MRGNKGEWSELYVLLKLISEGKVYGADKDLNQIDETYYDILRMIRKQTDGIWEYESESEINVNIINHHTDEIIASVPISEFRYNSELLLNEMVKIKSKTGAFEIPRLSDFINRIKVNSLKAKSIDKADIFIKMHDYKTGSDPTLGFSIKSMLGSPSTLLNAGGTTNFLYNITGNITDEIMEDFNGIYKVRGGKNIPDLRERFHHLKTNNVEIEYLDMCNRTFKNNLVLIDSSLPQICGWLLKDFYVSASHNCLEGLNNICISNPLEFDISGGQPFYHYKFKKLISESALGMLPGTTWTGLADATGGYLIVKEDGEILCYHLYNRNAFEDYLLQNTKFDTPSTSKYGFGYIYKKDGQYLIKLNMQIRFIK